MFIPALILAGGFFLLMFVGEGSGEWLSETSYRAKNKQIWAVAHVGDVWSATRPGIGGYVSASSKVDLATKMDAY